MPDDARLFMDGAMPWDLTGKDMLGVMESAAKDTEAKLKEGKAASEHRLAKPRNPRHFDGIEGGRVC